MAPLRAVPMTVILLSPLKPPPHPFPCTHRRDIACSFSLSLTCVAVGLLYAGRGSGTACGRVVKPAVCRRRCDRRARHLRPIRLASCGLHSSRCIGRQCLARMLVALFKAAADRWLPFAWRGSEAGSATAVTAAPSRRCECDSGEQREADYSSRRSRVWVRTQCEREAGRLWQRGV